MTQRATFRQADLNRAVKAAEARGWKVVLQGDTITLLPNPGDTGPSSADQAEAEWDKALGLGS